ncbi:glutamate decarboxylase gad1, partial [Spiromyces aspiralis]
VALEKFARYFDVEARTVPVSEESRYVLDPRKALEYIDENTIGMFIILGSTYTGHFESVEEMSRLLDDLQARTGIDVPIHVDGASGAFVAPFAFPEHRWAFDVSRVVSINASGHKYGLAYPGIGWVLWKSREYLPKDLIFELHYLGGTEETYTLNFSRPACFVIAQYYTFIRYGYKGYAQVMNTCLHNARLLSVALEATDIFCVLSDIHRPHGIKGHSTANIKAARELFIAESNKDYELHDPNQNLPYNVGVPVVSFRVSDEYLRDHPELDQDALSTMFRVRGWIVPNYELPRDCNNTYIFRIVVKETTTEDMVDNFLQDILWAVSTLEKISMKEHNVLSHIPQPSYHTIPKLARHLTNLGAREKKEEEAEEEGAKPAQRTKPAASGTLYDRIVGTYLRHKGSLDEVKRKSKGSGKDLFSHTC